MRVQSAYSSFIGGFLTRGLLQHSFTADHLQRRLSDEEEAVLPQSGHNSPLRNRRHSIVYFYRWVRFCFNRNSTVRRSFTDT